MQNTIHLLGMTYCGRVIILNQQELAKALCTNVYACFLAAGSVTWSSANRITLSFVLVLIQFLLSNLQ